MKYNIRHALAAFALSLILILGLLGFLAVDLGADRDMPGDYEPILRLTDIGKETMALTVFGRRYVYRPDKLEPLKPWIVRLSALLPMEAKVAGAVVVEILEWDGRGDS